MKYKFHEEPPTLKTNDDDRKWPEQACDNTHMFSKEICWIAKNLNLDVNKFRIDDMTFGDPVVFYDGKYFGYLLDDFYYAMDTDDWNEFLF